MKTLKKTLCLVLAVVMALSLFAVAASAKSLSDYSDAASVKSEYQVAVDVATQLGVLKGVNDTTYKANGTLTRAQLATMIYRITTGDVTDTYVGNYKNGTSFKDVKSDDWFAGYVNYCADNGYLEGVGNGKYAPNSTLTGYQAMAALLRALGYGKNGEFTGADWTKGVTKYAAAINTGMVVDWAKGITRQEAAQLVYNTLQAPMVEWVSILDRYVELKLNVGPINVAKTLAQTEFDVAPSDIYDGAVDNYGTPGEIWENSKDVVVAAAAYPVVKSYNTKVSVCDVLVGLGVPKTDTKTVVTATTWDGGIKREIKMSHDSTAEGVVDCDTTVIGGQGVLTRIYKDTQTKDYVITHTNTFLAKVTGVTNAGHGAKATTTVEIYKYPSAESRTLTDVTGWTKDAYVLVSQSAYDNTDVTIIGYAKSEVAKLGSIELTGTNIVDRSYVLSVGGVDRKYNITTQYNYSLPYNVEVGTVYTWYYDNYGNIIGVGPYSAPNTYGVIDGIKWVHTSSVKGDYAAADLVYMDAKMANDVKVTKVQNTADYPSDDATAVSNTDKEGNVKNGTVSDTASMNSRYYETIVTIADGVVLNQVGIDVDGTVSLTKNDPTIIITDSGMDISADASTVYLMKYKNAAGEIVYASYTGFAAMPSVTGAKISYVADADTDSYVDYVYVNVVDGQILDTVANTTIAFVAHEGPIGTKDLGEGKVEYTYAIWVGGTYSTIKSDEALTLEDNTLYKFVTGTNGKVSSYAKASGNDALVEAGEGSVASYIYRKGGDTAAMILAGGVWVDYEAADAVVYFVDDATNSITTKKLADVETSELPVATTKAFVDVTKDANGAIISIDAIYVIAK